MKRLGYALLLLILTGVEGWGQVRTTVTATIQSPTGGLATSGYVEFKISPQSSAIAYRVVGAGTIAPQTARCTINSSGQIPSCLVWANTLITPGNTTYTLVIAPNNTVVSTIQQVLITGTTYDLANLVISPSVKIVPEQAVITTSPINGNLIPAVNKAINLGSANLYYGTGYIDSLFTNNINSPLQSMTLDTLVVNNFNPINLNNIRKCDQFPGVNAGAKIAACITNLPATGGVADARGLEGAQTITQNVFNGIFNKPVTLLLGAATYSVSVTQVPKDSSVGYRIHGNGTTWKMTAAVPAWQIGGGAGIFAQDSVVFDGVDIQCNNIGTVGILINNNHYSDYSHSIITGCTTAGVTISNEEFQLTFRNITVKNSNRGVRLFDDGGIAGDRDKILFQDCDFTDNTLEGALLEAVHTVTFLGGSYERNTKGISLTLNSRNVSIYNGHFENNSIAEIDCIMAVPATDPPCVGGLTISGGYFYSSRTGSYGIRLRGANTAKITGVWSEGGHTLGFINFDNTGIGVSPNVNIALENYQALDTLGVVKEDGVVSASRLKDQVFAIGAAAELRLTAAGAGGVASDFSLLSDGGGACSAGASSAIAIFSRTASAYRLCIDGNGHIIPGGNGTQNIGDSTHKINNTFVNNVLVTSITTPAGNPVIRNVTPTGLTGNGALNAGAWDSQGQITVTSTAASTIVLTFSSAFSNAPVCIVHDQTTPANVLGAATSTTALTINGNVTNNDSLSYICHGK